MCLKSQRVKKAIVFGHCDGASQNPHLLDANFVCKIRRMQMRICARSKLLAIIATAIQLSYLELNSYEQTSSE